MNDAIPWAKSASVRVITRNRFDISMSPGEVPTDQLFLPLTNVHYSRPRRLLVLMRSRLTCSGAVRAGKNAAARCGISCRRVEGTGGLEPSEVQRAPAGLLIAITVNNLRQEANGCIGEKGRRRKALFCHADQELSCVHSDCWNCDACPCEIEVFFTTIKVANN